MEVKSEIKKAEKGQRLLNLQARYFQLQMDLTAYEANSDTAGIEYTKGKMEECEASYKAIEALE